MAWRDLKAYSLYRLRKLLLGLPRRGLKGSPPRGDDSEGKLDGRRPNSDNPFEAGWSEERSSLAQVKDMGDNLQAGSDGNKNSDWMPEEIDLQETKEAGKMIKKLVTSISRRRKIGHKRKRINVRATIHSNMHQGGILLKMKWEMRKPAKPHVVLILDTSSSMIGSAKLMLQFIYALQHELSSLEVFIFGNQINYVTPYLQQDFTSVLKEVRRLPQWNFGGTELWRPLAQLRDNYAHLFSARTVVIVLTDCMLYEKFFALAPLDRLRRKVKRLYLFNPDPRANDLNDYYYQETITNFKTVVDRMFYTESIHEVARALRQIIA